MAARAIRRLSESVMNVVIASLSVLVALSLSMPPPAHAASQTIHLCIDARGAKTYQDAPCAGAQRTLATREYAVATPDPALLKRSREIEAEMDRRNRGSGRAAIVRGSARKPAGPSPCEAAKAKRKATLDKVGLKRTFDLLSQLDNEVWAVCKGF
jgi:hypothetical protein